MSVIEDTQAPYRVEPFSETGPSGGHVLVMTQSDTAVNLADIPDTRHCTATFTQHAGYALQVLRELKPGIAILDVGRGTAGELSLIEEAASMGTRVVVTGPDSRGLFAQQALARGAMAFLEKPVQSEDIWRALERQNSDTGGTRSLPGENTTSGDNTREKKRQQPETGNASGHLAFSDSETMRHIAEQIARVAPTTASVLVTGESGTGKEVVAQAIHEQSDRRSKPFVPINCGAISPQLIESELFGHERGSFTGAVKDHQGVFERAHGGTLFLDEITEMPIELQVKLLRVLETQEFARVGSGRSQQADVRVICATNRSPEQEVAAGHLRADLLYRIQVFPIRLPPLREREGDIALLARHFLHELNDESGRNIRLAPEALRLMEDYHWPGNLRELKNVLQRAHIMADKIIRVDDLPEYVRNPLTTGGQNGPCLTVNIGTSVAEMEKNLILATLDQCKGRKDRAAQVLGVSLKTLYNRLRDYERDRS